MIIVTGATGALNGSTVEHLLESVPASELVVVARDVAKAAHFEDRGVAVRRGDYAEPSSLPAAFAGADQLLLVSSSDPTADAVALHRNAVEAAVAARVGRVLYTSHQGAASDTPFSPGRDHAATERMLADSGLRWTSLRNGFYAHSLEWFLGDWRRTGVISIPADGPVSWSARADAAEAAARIMLSDGAYEGPVTLTAPAAPTFADVAAIAADVAGRRVETVVLGDEEWVARQVAAGQQEFLARFMLGMYHAAAGGFFAGTDPLLGEVLDREPASVRDLITAQPSTAD
ncbi:NAD(P)H-binding protein [Curtobacterium citreum]|uniref:NAD(P)H-binding protein n=1 Tax=Curtobacterium citreum TaxID=2036 RepID=UPI002543571C|nr:NAD(P)H-binding protein [Curtobacterium citreum]WIJ45532.1 NAD(P)H-binding protein [Curtobacterium citreum]